MVHRLVGDLACLRDVERNPGWEAFMQSLADEGFFGEVRIGTPRHNELLAEAARRFTASSMYTEGRDSPRDPAARLHAFLDEGCAFDHTQVGRTPHARPFRKIPDVQGWSAYAAGSGNPKFVTSCLLGELLCYLRLL